MTAGANSIEEISHADRERLARMVREQPAVTREAWEKQVKLFKNAELKELFWTRVARIFR